MLVNPHVWPADRSVSSASASRYVTDGDSVATSADNDVKVKL